MADLEVTTRQAADALILELRGDLDGRATEQMQAAQQAAGASPPEVLVLDFEQLGYMNSTGIALIVGVLADARRLGVDVRVCGLSEHYRHIFEITRLADFVSFHADASHAVDRPDSHAS